ncbi:MAG: ATP-grasp domain-containing protein [Gemmatimonadales bacterium]
MKVAILYDGGWDTWDAKDVASVVDSVKEVQIALKARGHETTLVAVRRPDDFGWLSRVRRADLIFNLCEGIGGHSRYEDFVVSTLELTGVPYTGCKPWAVSVAHRKHVANTLLSRNGVSIPRFQLAAGNKVPPDLTLPVIVKPAAEDASVGIDTSSVCTTKRALKKRLAEMSEQWEEVLVQEYVAGREFNVGFIGETALPIAELCFDNMPEGSWPILTYAAKWDVGSPEDLGSVPVCPADLPSEVQKRIVAVARQGWEELCGAEGYGRVDLRVDAQGQPYILEVNPNPDISDSAGLSRMAKARGWEYDELIARIVDEALSRTSSRQAAAALTVTDAAPAT